MHIVDVAEYYADRGGGVRTYIDHKLRAGAALGHKITIIAPGPETRVESRLGGRIQWVKAPRLPFDDRYHIFWNTDDIHRLLDEIQPDVVEGSSAFRGAKAVTTWRGDAVKSWFIHQDPVAGYVHTFFDRYIERPTLDRVVGRFWRYMRDLSWGFDTAVVGAPWLADRFASFGLQRPLAIPVGVDQGAFSPELASMAARTELAEMCGLPDPSVPLLIAVSRHHPEKRLGAIIEGFAMASADRPMGLVIFGDGPARAWVERHAARVPHVHVFGALGDRSRLARYMASADALLHGSAAEICATVVAEAMASGLPLIVPDFGGALGWAADDYAEVYKAGDPHACADAIKRLLARDRDGLRHAARAAANRDLTLPAEHYQRLFDHYQALVDQRRSERLPAAAELRAVA